MYYEDFVLLKTKNGRPESQRQRFSKRYILVSMYSTHNLLINTKV